MSAGVDDDGALREIGIPRDDDDSANDYSSFVGGNSVNHSQKILLKSSTLKNGFSDHKPEFQTPNGLPRDTSEEAFEFDNIKMVKEVRVDPDRIVYNEQGHARTLETVIKKLD